MARLSAAAAAPGRWRRHVPCREAVEADLVTSDWITLNNPPGGGRAPRRACHMASECAIRGRATAPRGFRGVRLGRSHHSSTPGQQTRLSRLERE